jgi:hypothetical protein
MAARKAWQGVAVVGLAALLAGLPVRARAGQAGGSVVSPRQAALCSQLQSLLTATQLQALSVQGEVAIAAATATPPQRDLLQQLQKSMQKSAGEVRVLVRRTGTADGTPVLELWLASGSGEPRRIKSQPLALVCGWG